jgi:hypothetical protein
VGSFAGSRNCLPYGHVESGGCTFTFQPGDDRLRCNTAMLLQLAAAKAWWFVYGDVSAVAMVVRVRPHPCRGGVFMPCHDGVSQTANPGRCIACCRGSAEQVVCL